MTRNCTTCHHDNECPVYKKIYDDCVEEGYDTSSADLEAGAISVEIGFGGKCKKWTISQHDYNQDIVKAAMAEDIAKWESK